MTGGGGLVGEGEWRAVPGLPRTPGVSIPGEDRRGVGGAAVDSPERWPEVL